MRRSGVFRMVAEVLLGLAVAAGAFAAAQWAARALPGGEALRYPWEALRQMVLHGENPYAQWRLLYAWSAPHGYPVPQLYPFHVAVVFFLPLALIKDFVVVRALAMVGMAVAWSAAAWRASRVFGWRGGKALGIGVFLFGISWFFAAEAMWRGDVVGLVLALDVLALTALTRRQYRLAGGLLALTLIKPMVALPVVIFLLLWAFSRGKWRLWGGFWGVTAILFGFSWWLLPAWPLDAARLAVQFAGHQTIYRLVADAVPGIGRQLGWLVLAVPGALVFLEWLGAWGKSSSRAVWTAALTIWGSMWWGLQLTVADQALLLLPLALVWLHWSGRWKAYGRLAVWVSLLGFWIVSWALWWPYGWHPEVMTSSLAVRLVVPLLVWPLLYSVRWWATRTYAAWEDTLPLDQL